MEAPAGWVGTDRVGHASRSPFFLFFFTWAAISRSASSSGKTDSNQSLDNKPLAHSFATGDVELDDGDEEEDEDEDGDGGDDKGFSGSPQNGIVCVCGGKTTRKNGGKRHRE